MLWKSGKIELRIWPLDHCPPHVTAVCRPDAWTARFEFSMVEEAVALLDVKPLRNAPTLAVLNRLAKQIHGNRLMCRTSWWQIQQTVCPDNAPVKWQQSTKQAMLLPSGSVGTGSVIKGSGMYLSGRGVQASVNWGESVTIEWLKEV